MDYNHYKLHSSLDYISLLVILTFLSGITFVSAVYGQENIVFPADSGIINVRDYGAVGDGVTDDTQAIRNAMAARTQGVDVLVYFPNGTYKVRDTLAWSNPFERYCTLQGQSKNGTFIKLENNSQYFQDANNPRAVVSALDWDHFSLEGFRNYLRNLTVDIGSGNPGAVGVDFHANNFGGIFDVDIRTSDPDRIGHTGLRMPDERPGPMLIKNVGIFGFDTGIDIVHGLSVTFEHIQLTQQRVLGVKTDSNLLTFRDLISENSVPVANITTMKGFFQVIEGQFSGGDSGTTAVLCPSGMVHLRDVTVSGYTTAVSDLNGDLPAGFVTEYLTHEFRSTPASALTSSLRLPIEETPEVQWDSLDQWANIVPYGAVSGDSKPVFFGEPTDNGDDSAAIQAAIDSGSSTVYFPTGVWTINSTVYIRGNVRRIIGMESTLQAGATLVANGSPVFVFQDGTHPTVVFERFGTDYMSILGPFIRHDSSCTLVLKSMSGMGGAENRYDYETGPNGTGNVFVEDCSFRMNLINQNAWLRQYNPENFGDPHLVNNGSNVFILGMKTEGVATQIETRNGGKTELLGGLLAATNWVPDSLPDIVNDESQVCVIAGTGLDPVAQQNFVVDETLYGQNRTIYSDAFPYRSDSEYRAWDGLYVPAGRWYSYGGGYSSGVDNNDLREFAADWLRSAEYIYPAEPNDANLLLHYTLDEQSGDLVADSSGNGNTATRFNMEDADWIGGRFGNALEFDGVDEYVYRSTLAETVTADFSISCWINMTVANGALRALDLDGFQIRFDYSGRVGWDNGGGPSHETFSNVDIDDGLWHHVIFMRSGTGYQMYVDGQADSNDTGTVESYNWIYLGRQSSGSYFAGKLDDVRIYDYALSLAQVLSLAEASFIYIPLDSPANLYDDDIINFKDFAILASQWLESW